MTASVQNIVDLTRDLARAANMGASLETVDELLGESLEAFGSLMPFDLATVMELAGDELRVRVARGLLASPRVAEHRLPLSPTLREVIRSGRARAFTEADHAGPDGDAFDGVLDLPHGHSCMVVPLRTREQSVGVMTLDRQSCGRYPDSVVQLADVFGKLMGIAMSYGEQSAMLARLRDQLQEQNRLLSERMGGRSDACRLLETSTSPAMRHVVHVARQVAATTTPVLITGETGTGKEVLANAIHGWSPRAGEPLVSINCAALPPTLIESELFGHVKGAFSGATTARMGRFQAANGGTLLLDEVGELPLELQPKLLRALQEGCFEPVGSDRTVRVDVRVIAATNVDLMAAVQARRFREDLYYRLAVFPVALPPLRARREDIAVIAAGFLDSLSRRTGRGPWSLGEGARAWAEKQAWPGNVRELVNALERATILAGGPELELADVAGTETAALASTADGADLATEIVTLEEAERRHIQRALAATGGKLYGAGGAAGLLRINPSTLRSRMKKLGLGGARGFRRS